MKHTLNIWVIGGDLRQAKLAELLQNDGHSVHTYALDCAPEMPCSLESTLSDINLADCVIFPLPISGDGILLNAPLSKETHPLSLFFPFLRPKQILCAGKVDVHTHSMAQEHGLELHDYFAREELAVANSVPTVEGALQIAMEELPITLHGCRALVIGYGRLGKLMSQRLHVLGAKVSVSARKWADLTWAEAYGYGVEQTNFLDGWLCGYDLIVNTVPAQILTEPRLAELKPGCLVIDLASKPGGVDLDAARKLGVRVIWALSLPGKVAPVSAGKAIRDTVYNILREQGV